MTKPRRRNDRADRFVQYRSVRVAVRGNPVGTGMSLHRRSTFTFFGVWPAAEYESGREMSEIAGAARVRTWFTVVLGDAG